ncbi:MAG: YciI family protein [Caldilineaceae bacterium]|nr:YciI family protein [Caldilineaceae bacterium]
MKYLLLAYRDEKWWDALPISERNAFENACLANNEALRQGGYLLAAGDLQSSHAATVRVHNGKVSIADGPLVQTREQLIGIFCIDARDLNNAISVASKMPQAQAGSIEVRPVTEFDPFMGIFVA